MRFYGLLLNVFLVTLGLESVYASVSDTIFENPHTTTTPVVKAHEKSPKKQKVEPKEEPSSRLIHSFLSQEYTRENVTRFLKSIPQNQKKFAELLGVSESTLSKLKNPEKYGDLKPSAQKVWEFVKNQKIEDLSRKLRWKKTHEEKFYKKLITADFSKQSIVFDELKTDDDDYTVTQLIDDIKNLDHTTILNINLSGNLFYDGGLDLIVSELLRHPQWELINLSHTELTDIGLRKLSPLLRKLPNLKKLLIYENCGPGEETLKVLTGDDEGLKAKLKY